MKKFLSLVVAALLSVSVATSVSAAKFTDVDASNEALTDAVELLSALNVTKGTTETTFGTEENVTRQQMAAFIYRMMKAGKSVEGGNNTSSFTDLDDPTFYFMISWANSTGIIKGRSATEFDPKGGIILQDAYTMIVRALGYDDGTLSYPIEYISLAEDLGLDEDLPSSLNYTDTLTRGDVAIILANMFYADTAETTIEYVPNFIEVCSEHKNNKNGCPDDCTNDSDIVNIGSTPKEVHMTLAESVFDVIEVTQRVIATPNFSLNGTTVTEDDIDFVKFLDVDEDSNIVLGEREFSELGLEGTADDYFLSDIVMFVREVDDEYEIFGATASGSKDIISFDDVEFGTVSGTSADKYYDGADKEYKMINGKLTLGDSVTYLFDAPYSFAKGKDYTPKFLELGAAQANEEEDVVNTFMTYNVVEKALDDSIIGATYTEAVEDNEETPDVDESADGYWTLDYDGYLSQVYYGGVGEIEAIDCNGDGKYEYLFVKPYSVGVINTEEDRSVAEGDYDLSAEIEQAEIFTDMSIVEGVEYADGDVVLAYVDEAANYVKVAEVLEAKEATVSTLASNEYIILSTGEKILFENATAVVANGDVSLADIGNDVDFNEEATYYFAENGTLVYVTGLATTLNLDTDWVVVLSEGAFESAQMVDGKIERSYYIDIYHDGEQKSVKAQAIAAGSTYTGNTGDGDTFEETPVTVCSCTDAVHGAYCYKAYVNELATAKTTKKGATYFKLLDVEVNDDFDALSGDDEAAEYREKVTGTTKFFKKSGYIYELEAATDAAKAESVTLRGVNIKPYTQIIIRSKDKDDQTVVTKYGYDNLPDIKEDIEFSNVTYVLVNNTNSKAYENLAVFYGTIEDELKGASGKVAELRVIKGNALQTSTEEGTLLTFDVYNPFTGEAEAGIDGIDGVETSYADGSIVALTTTGLIDNELGIAGNAFTAGVIYNTDDADFEDFTDEGDKLGYVFVDEYDTTTGYLMIAEDDGIYQITDETVVSFADKSEKTIKAVDADVLASTSKAYRQDENKNNALRVFLCVEEDDEADSEDEFYLVKFAMIVRD